MRSKIFLTNTIKICIFFIIISGKWNYIASVNILNIYYNINVESYVIVEYGDLYVEYGDLYVDIYGLYVEYDGLYVEYGDNKLEYILDARVINGSMILLDRLFSFTYYVNDLPNILNNILTTIKLPFIPHIVLYVVELDND